MVRAQQRSGKGERMSASSKEIDPEIWKRNLRDTTMTDDNGYFRVAKLQPSAYVVKIEASGFALFTAEKVIVQVGSVTDLPAKLNLASAGATVLVSAETPSVNTDSPNFSPIVDQEQISNLPINGGRWSDFALLTPGVVNDSSGFGLLSFRGMSTLLNNNTIDGADNNQAFFSEERGRTRAGYSSAKAAVQEFQVNTSNYSSEYGRAAGAVVFLAGRPGALEEALRQAGISGFIFAGCDVLAALRAAHSLIANPRIAT
jgi:hypothetical protein